MINNFYGEYINPHDTEILEYLSNLIAKDILVGEDIDFLPEMDNVAAVDEEGYVIEMRCMNYHPEMIDFLLELDHLEKLVFRYANIDEFPVRLFAHPQLEILDMTENAIAKISSFDIQNQTLKVLSVSRNKLKDLPETLQNLTALEEFYARQNILTMIPNTIGKLRRLKIIDLNYNKIPSLPPSIYDLVNLEELNIGLNPIEEISPAILNLTKLQRLKLFKTKVQQLPPGTLDLPKLGRAFIPDHLLNRDS